MNKKISTLSRMMMVVAGFLLAISIFVPIWRIDLDAPQYPEGLRLFIYAYTLGGNVDIINGLNHYIGMKTLHADEFIEFKILPYIIGGFVLLSLLVSVSGSRKFLYVVFAAFVLFGVVAMYDFWRWEYDYGHNLDPNAAIVVPGMAYQPPLIGFKQLLNFGAYSIPALGGWLFVSSGALMLLTIFIERRSVKKNSKTRIAAVMGLLFCMSCSQEEPEVIKLNTDACAFCKMTIVDGRFAAEILTTKGRAYKFDDLSCMLNYDKESEKRSGNRFYVADFITRNLEQTGDVTFITGENVESPMGGNVAAFKNSDSAIVYAARMQAEQVKWDHLRK